MQYQVVARTCLPSAGKWEYYPYLVPGRDRAAAERLARYAAQSGCEAAILQGVSMEMLVDTARAVVEQQDERLLPAVRYLPGAGLGSAGSRPGVVRRFSAAATIEPFHEGPDKVAMDAHRTRIEMGPGGDVEARGAQRGVPLVFPRRMDVVRLWLRLRERVVQGQVGGPKDGADDAADVENVS